MLLSNVEKTIKKWSGLNEDLDQWLDKRQTLIIEYCKLGERNANTPRLTVATLPSHSLLRGFCQHLVDYLSEGHFRLQARVAVLLEESEITLNGRAAEVYKKITDTTEPLLSFTDKYSLPEQLSNHELLEEFEYDLSQVGELIEMRFALEDEVIKYVLQALKVNGIE